jgi:hypothetical protein
VRADSVFEIRGTVEHFDDFADYPLDSDFRGHNHHSPKTLVVTIVRASTIFSATFEAAE